MSKKVLFKEEKKRINQIVRLDNIWTSLYHLAYFRQEMSPIVSIIVEEQQACLKDLQALENFHRAIVHILKYSNHATLLF